jgi:hypothetical protein
MPLINIPKGQEIKNTTGNNIKIKIKNTDFWILGEQQTSKKWNIYIYDPETKRKEILRENETTKTFALFSNIILKTPLPYEGKNANDLETIKKLIKKITK